MTRTAITRPVSPSLSPWRVSKPRAGTGTERAVKSWRRGSRGSLGRWNGSGVSGDSREGLSQGGSSRDGLRARETQRQLRSGRLRPCIRRGTPSVAVSRVPGGQGGRDGVRGGERACVACSRPGSGAARGAPGRSEARLERNTPAASAQLQKHAPSRSQAPSPPWGHRLSPGSRLHGTAGTGRGTPRCPLAETSCPAESGAGSLSQFSPATPCPPSGLHPQGGEAGARG